MLIKRLFNYVGSDGGHHKFRLNAPEDWTALKDQFKKIWRAMESWRPEDYETYGPKQYPCLVVIYQSEGVEWENYESFFVYPVDMKCKCRDNMSENEKQKHDKREAWIAEAVSKNAEVPEENQNDEPAVDPEDPLSSP